MNTGRKVHLIVINLAVIALALMAGACGESKKEGGVTSAEVPLSQAANVGSSVCKVCHSALTHTVLNWLVGVNPDPSGLASGITHDCEACHGGGQYHYGLGPMPYPSPTASRCATCHTQIGTVVASKHNAEEAGNIDMIATDHDTGKCQRCHTAEGSRVFAGIIGNKAAYNAIVSYGTVPGAGEVAALPNLLDMSKSGDAAYTAVRENHTLHNPTCAACHNPLSTEIVSMAAVNWDPNGNSKADQFDMCTSCHVYNLNNNGTLIGSGQTYTVSVGSGADNVWFTADDVLSGGTATEAHYHNTSWYRVIASTHYDNAGSPNVIEGYVIRKDSANPCFDCHNHELKTNTRYANTTEAGKDATPTIFTDWAESGHAGGLLKKKYEVARTNGVNISGTANLTDTVMSVGASYTDAVWAHYNWDDRASRGACQVCHTATGISNFLNDPANYNLNGLGGTLNDYSHLEGWTPAGSSNQNELLYCWGCHANSTGALRNPGPIPTVYAYEGVYASANITVVFPEARKSNVCLRCHGGRGNNDTIRANVNDADANLVDSTNRSTRAAEHHAPTAASLYAAYTHSGYEYTGQDYTGAPTHASIDIGTGGNGPCVSCHMGGSTEPAADQKKHTYEAALEDGGGNITSIVHQATCNVASCHGGGMSVSFLQGQKDGFAAAKTVLGALMSNSVMNYQNLNISTTSNNNYRTVPPEAYGALMNYLYLSEDPCSFVHNNRYARRLIFDSIDWMQDGDLDGTIDISAFPTGAAAAAFLRPGSPSNAVTRP